MPPPYQQPASPTYWIWENYVGIQTSINKGALFGIGQNFTYGFAVLSVVAAVGILYWLFYRGAAQDKLLTVALGSITGGIFGNLYDRLALWDVPGLDGQRIHAVRDWILFQAGDLPIPPWPNFNIADSMLVCGAGMLVWHSFRNPGDKRGEETAKSA